MVGKWHLGFDEKSYTEPLPGGPVDRGFESFFGIRASTDIPPYFYIRDNRAIEPPTAHIEDSQSAGWSPIQGAFWRAGGIAPGLDLADVLPRFTDEAIAVIDRHASSAISESPLFLYLAYPAPHTPWLPSHEFRGKSGAGMYGDFMVMVDAMIGRVLQALEDQGMSDNTMILFTSDNGPVWYDEDVERLGHDSSGGLRGMKSDAWEAGHRMPFIVRWPGVVEPGSVCDHTIGFVDVMATLADITGMELSADAGPDSVSFLPLLKGAYRDSAPFRSPLLVQSGGGFMTIRKGPWKLIRGLGSGGFSKPRKIEPEPGEPASQLYRLDADPSESTNLAARHPEIVEELGTDIDRILSASRSRAQ
jgi:arylsulfatase A-like enzyme